MCGLAGTVTADPSAPGDSERARRMIGRLRHRGPDGEGSRSFEGCALAHTRLAIIDLSRRGAQPMANEDGRVWVVFNGEIYNYQELRRELEGRHRFRSKSDTEVILHLYEEKEERAVESLRGMFALAIWDEERRRLILARDRLGKKPLHYRVRADGLDFASEIPALLAAGGDRRLDPEVLGTYLCLGYVPAPATAIQGVRRLPAGSILTYQDGEVNLQRYWSPPLPATSEGATQGPEEAARRILPVLEESVEIRLRSDVPLGVFLSGGIDSALVAALAARHSSQPLRTFTVVFGESDYDESAAARETARIIGSEHREIRVEARATETLPALIRLAGDPLADSSLVAMHGLARAVAAEVKVALSGDGGDEVFLGYDRYRAHRLAERWRRWPAPARSAARVAAGVLPGPRGRRNLAGRVARFMDGAAEDPFARNDRWLCRFPPSRLGEILSHDAAALQPRDPLALLHRHYADAASATPLEAIARADLALWLPEDVLRKVDTASMACSLEVRSPLLDHRLVERAAALPAEVRMPRSRGKEILRSLAGGILSRKVSRAPKAGFGLPVDRWLRGGALGDLSHDTLESPSFRARGLFREAEVARLLREHRSGEANHDEAIWTMMVLEIFLREVVDAAA